MGMIDGWCKGSFVMGENPTVGKANGKLHRLALANLDCLVVRDVQETETKLPERAKRLVRRERSYTTWLWEPPPGRWARWRSTPPPTPTWPAGAATLQQRQRSA
jgi:anaerobic selenocysteine-containing dehydrogenase